jgi:hypothetical protein
MDNTKLGPAAPLYAKAKRPPLKTLRTDTYLQRNIPKDKNILFWTDKLLSSRVDLSIGDIILYGRSAVKGLYRRYINNNNFLDALKEYRSRSKTTRTSAAYIALRPASVEDKDEDEDD